VAKRKSDLIQLATGPYEINRDNCIAQAERIRYRHYKPDELEIAKDFIRGCYLPGKYFFDVYLLTAAAKEIFKTIDIPMLKDLVPWLMRIDAICYKARTVFILEIKERLRPSGIGELVTYKQLFLEQYQPDKEIVLGYVVRRDDPTLHTLLSKEQISLWVVPPFYV